MEAPGSPRPESFLFPSSLASCPNSNQSPNLMRHELDASKMEVASTPASRIKLSTLNQDLSSLQQSIEGIQKSQEDQDTSLRSFIQYEFHALKAFMMQEMETFRDNHREVLFKNLTEHQSRTEEILTKLNPNSLREFENGLAFAAGEVGAGGDKPSESKRSLRTSETVTPHAWNDFLAKVNDDDTRCMYKEVMQRKLARTGFWQDLFHACNLPILWYTHQPDTFLANLTVHPMFIAVQTIVILCNTALMAYETDAGIDAVRNGEDLPSWISAGNLIFNLIFAAELVFRISVLRSWFFTAPGEWGWNYFDMVLVLWSLVSEFFHGSQLSFLRAFRMLRAARVARIIRLARFFRHLRRMVFAILACLSSLAWAFVFLTMVMFMFSILFVQGVTIALEEEDSQSLQRVMKENEIDLYFDSLGGAMLSLLAAVSGGMDWMVIKKPLDYAGSFYAALFVVYLLFVTVGLMNVLTGVFLSNADEFTDLSLMIAGEEAKVDGFVEQMLELFKILDTKEAGIVDWDTFHKVMRNDAVRAYFSALQLEPTHIRLIFDLLDEHRTGKIALNDFVMGMVRLKGEAKAIDARIIQREIGMLPLFFHNLLVGNDVMRREGTERVTDV